MYDDVFNQHYEMPERSADEYADMDVTEETYEIDEE
jgi:hypothetical protein